MPNAALRYHPPMAFPAHVSASHRSLRITRLALLWLALLLAIAQSVAILHVYTHSPLETSTSSAGQHPGGLAHCNLCIVAASVAGAAPPTPALLLPALAHDVPPLAAQYAPQSAPHYPRYAIRAPPGIAS